MDGLQPVAYVRERSPHDHAHGVIEVGGAHLLLEPARLDVPAGQLIDAHWLCSTSAPPQARSAWTAPEGALNVEIGHLPCVVLDELAPGLHVVPHEHREDLVDRARVVDRDELERALLWIPGRATAPVRPQPA